MKITFTLLLLVSQPSGVFTTLSKGLKERLAERSEQPFKSCLSLSDEENTLWIVISLSMLSMRKIGCCHDFEAFAGSFMAHDDESTHVSWRDDVSL